MDKRAWAIAQAIFIPILGLGLGAGIGGSPYSTELVELAAYASPTDRLHIAGLAPPNL